MPDVSIPLEPGEVAKITRTGPYVFAERMQFLSVDQAKLTGPVWHGPADTIQRTVAAFYQIEPEVMRSDARDRESSWPRQRAMWLVRTLTYKSLPTIGHLFGDRDHTTVIHAIKAVDKRMAEDPLERAQMKQLLASLEHLRRPE